MGKKYIFIALCNVLLLFVCVNLNAGELDIGSTRELPVTHHGFLAPKPNMDTMQIIEKARIVLKEKEVSEASYEVRYIKESNSVFVKASDEQTKTMVWTTLNDVVNWQYQSSYTDVITLQYANAMEIAEILSNIYSPKIYQKLSDGTHVIKKTENNIDISPEARTNCLIVTAPSGVIDGIRATVQKLDRRTMQVLIKVLIAEITLDENSEFGVEWNFTENTFFSQEDTQAESLVDFGSRTGAKTKDWKTDMLGLKYSILRDNLNAFLQMLQSTSKINVLSSPQLMTSNNSEAQFEETTNVPIETVTTTTTATGSKIEYKDIGIRLKVKPQINIDEYINLKIEQTIQDITKSTAVDKAPVYSNRMVKTDV
ncbi:MAG: secretin N-terminal domain-containing protein, partial [Candidatus Wallbacteria bacterium]|nr:secretin N-terminal domain-containing protein [Candidatus Wallbacteria bacterium]